MHERFEIEPRPAAVGGGWRLRLIGRDLETGDEIELGGGVFPVEPGEDERDAYADAMQPAKNDWMRILEVDAYPKLVYLTLEVLFITHLFNVLYLRFIKAKGNWLPAQLCGPNKDP